MIVTALGPIEASSVKGSCSPQEHLLHKLSPSDLKAVLDAPITLANISEVRRRSSADGDGKGKFALSNRLFSMDESVQELESLADAGGGLVVACSTQQEGRDPAGLAEISRRTGMHVVMAASSRGEHNSTAEQPSPETIGRELEHQLLFGEHVSDPNTAVSSSTTLLSTASNTRVQAGIIVVRLNHESPEDGDTAGTMSDETRRALEGAAWAHKATAAPLMVICSHFVRWSRVEAAVVVVCNHLGDETNVAKKIILAGMHSGVSQPIAGQVAMLKKGLVLCFDCFGRVEWLSGPNFYPSDENNAVRIVELTKQGFADKMLISQGVSRRIHLSRCGGHGYGHALRTVPARLQRLGVSAEDIALMTRENLLGLVEWYTPPPPPEIPKDYLPCSWCKERFEPVEGEYFHKYQFVYCGIKCLRLHRDTGFDASRVGVVE